MKEFDPEAIEENTEEDTDPVEGAEFDEFENDNAEDFEELDENIDEDEPVIESDDDLSPELNQADVGVDDE